MGKLSEIPRLRAVLAEKTAQRREEFRGSSDLTGLTHREGRSLILGRCQWASRVAVFSVVGTPTVVVAYADTIKDPNDAFMRDDIAEVIRSIDRYCKPDIRITNCAGFESLVSQLQAVEPTPPDQDYTYVGHGKAGSTAAESLTTQFGNANAALLAENDRLTRQVAELQADIRRRTTRFNPASCREEPWDAQEELHKISITMGKSLSDAGLVHRYEGYPLTYVIENVVKDLGVAVARLSGIPASAEPAECAALLGLKAVKVEPGMLLAIREPPPGGPVPASALKRMATALLSELTKRYGSMTYGAPTVLCIPHGATLEAVPTNGRGPVQVNVHPEGHPKKPTDVPKHVARAYAEAAAASYGVTPEVVQAKRKTRGLRRALARRVDARIDAPDSPFITRQVRNEHRTIGRDIIAYDDPSDLMCADACHEDGERS